MRHRPQENYERSRIYPDKAVLGFEFLGHSDVVINKSETSALATTELCPETIDKDALGILDLVHLGQLFPKLGLGNIGAALVDDVNDLYNSPPKLVVSVDG